MTLYAVELNGAGGYEPGTAERRVTRTLTAADRAGLVGGLAKLDFWTLTPHSPEQGYDGEQWILEGRRGQAYRVVERWSPETGPFRQFCVSLLVQAGFMDLVMQ